VGLVWNNGDGTDVINGGAGRDDVEVNGSPTPGDAFAVQPNGPRIKFDRRKIAVTPEQLNGAEREAAWRQITAAAPRFAKYQQKTDREVPIIRLVPRSG
jgi:hypothetical protein